MGALPRLCSRSGLQLPRSVALFYVLLPGSVLPGLRSEERESLLLYVECVTGLWSVQAKFEPKICMGA